MNTQAKNKKGLGALDIFIILAVVVCIAGAAIRYFVVNNDSADSGAVLGNYIVSFEVYNIRDSSAQNYFDKGMNFYMAEDNAFFGKIKENVSISDAERYYTMNDGSVKLIGNTGTGDQYRVDVAGYMTCRGTLNENGSFLLNGNQYLAIGKEVKLYSKYLTVTIKVTGITAE